MIPFSNHFLKMDTYFVILSFFISITQIQSASNIRMQRDFRYPVIENFTVYWNVPTFMCHKHGINFQEHTERFGILANHGDQFRGDYINILYDPGFFPAMLKSSGNRMVERNGGIPQMGNLTRHLESFKSTVEKLIPERFSGVGIIDFESWRPIFRQNWNSDEIYKDMSREIVRQKHPQWKENKIEAQAKKNFEYSAKVFMETTLQLAKILRPRAKWGYYAFPYCFNYRPHGGMEPWCPQDVEKENNRIQWLFDESTAIYPSLYMSSRLDTEDHRKFVIGRLNEAWRVTSRVSSGYIPAVYPYIWYKYYDSSDFLTDKDIYNTLETTRKYKMGGAIIWGATNDVITKEKCLKLLTYLNKVLGPTVQRVKRENGQRFTETELEFVPLVIVPNNGAKSNANYTNNLSFHYDVVKRDETSSNKPKSSKVPATRSVSSATTSATPRLSKIANWYQDVLKYVFNLQYPKD